MKRYWDTSALIDCLDSDSALALVLEPDQWTRSHSLSEMFSTLTKNRNFSARIRPGKAFVMIQDVTAKMNFVDLTPKEMFSALEMAEKKGVSGSGVHDWIHAVAAKKAGVETLLTLNLAHFENLKMGFKVEAPPMD